MKVLITLLGFVVFVSPIAATPITFTGAELASLPGARAVAGNHALIGDSLRITATSDYQILYTLDLEEFVLDGAPISFIASVTRLTTSGGFRDHDIRLGLSDGRIYLFGDYPNLSTNSNVSPSHNTGSISNVGRNFIEHSPFGITDGAGWNFGETANLGVTITATPFATRITTSFNGYRIFTSTASSVRSLDPLRGLSLTIGSHVATQRYQINSLTFTSGVSLPTPAPTPVSEPGPIGGMGLGLVGLAADLSWRKRRRKNEG